MSSWLKATTSSVTHCGGSVMACACNVKHANGTGSPVFIKDFIFVRRNRMNAEVYRSILCSDSSSLDDTSVFSRTRILNIWPEQPQSFSVWREWNNLINYLTSVWLSSISLGEDQTKGRETPQQAGAEVPAERLWESVHYIYSMQYATSVYTSLFIFFSFTINAECILWRDIMTS